MGALQAKKSWGLGRGDDLQMETTISARAMGAKSAIMPRDVLSGAHGIGGDMGLEMAQPRL